MAAKGHGDGANIRIGCRAGVADDQVKHVALAGHEVHQRHHRIDHFRHRFGRGQGLDGVKVPVDFCADQLIHQDVFVFEMRKKRAFGHTGAQHNFFDTQGVIATFLNHRFCRVQKLGAGFECALLNGASHALFLA